MDVMSLRHDWNKFLSRKPWIHFRDVNQTKLTGTSEHPFRGTESTTNSHTLENALKERCKLPFKFLSKCHLVRLFKLMSIQQQTLVLISNKKSLHVLLQTKINHIYQINKSSHFQVCPLPQPTDSFMAHSLLLDTVLDDSKKLLDFNIQQDSTIYVVIKPPSKDLLSFDECKSCNCQVIDPCALPCGHSCCKACISADATLCPVVGCKSPFHGLTRDTLAANWLAFQFFDAKESKPMKMCQSCAEDGTQQEATQWCESCSKVGSMEYYCDECAASEHSSKSAKTHTRVPLEKMVSSTSLPECPKHKMPHKLFCFDENVLICHQCRDEDHKPPHKTKLVVDCEKDIKNELKASVAVLTDLKELEKEDDELKKSENETKDEIARLEKKLEVISARRKEIFENTTKCKSASTVLMKMIDECTFQDLFDSKKLRIMKSRVDQTLKLVDKEPLPKPTTQNPAKRPVLKQQYSFKSKFGTYGNGNGQLSSPHGITIEPSTGNIYIADTGNNRIQAFNRDGIFVRVIGSSGSGDVQFSSPSGLTFDKNGNLVVADTSNNRIQVIDVLTGQLKFKFGSHGNANGQFYNPYYVTTTQDGQIIVSDYANHRLQYFSSTGVWLKTFAPGKGTGVGQLSFPMGVCVDSKGNTIICDKNNHRLQIFDTNGQSIKVIGGPKPANGNGQFYCPWGIDIDANDSILVVDQHNHRMQIFANGQFVMTVGSNGKGDGQIKNAVGAAIDQDGNIILLDRLNNRVQIFG